MYQYLSFFSVRCQVDGNGTKILRCLVLYFNSLSFIHWYITLYLPSPEYFIIQKCLYNCIGIIVNNFFRFFPYHFERFSFYFKSFPMHFQYILCTSFNYKVCLIVIHNFTLYMALLMICAFIFSLI